MTIFQGLAVTIFSGLIQYIHIQGFIFDALHHSAFSVHSKIILLASQKAVIGSVDYQLYDESEISFNNAQTIDCSEHCHCKATDLLQLIDIRIAGYRHTQPGHAKIFGFFAARDKIEPLRNCI